MARPTKQGIDYFPLDCAFDDKTEMYLIEKGAAGLAVLITIWQMIYSNHGYYVNDGEDLRLIVKKRIDVGINEVSDCINCAIKRGLFCESMQTTYGILTSKAIQKRYFDAAKKKRAINIVSDYALIDVSAFQNLVNVGGNATKVKEEVKEKVKEEEKGKAKGKPKGEGKPASAVDFSVFNLSDNDLAEVKRIRVQNKGGAIKTQRVASGLAKEIDMALAMGLTIDYILTEWETRGWKSFKAEWVAGNSFSTGQPAANSVQREEEINDWINKPSGGLFAPDQPFIEGEVIPNG